MKRVKYSLRGLLLLLTILLLVYMNRKSGVNLDTIARFKIEAFNKVQTDSLNNKDKVDMLVKETTKLSGQINEDSSAREVIYYLIGIVGLFIASELVFFIMERKGIFNGNQN